MAKPTAASPLRAIKGHVSTPRVESVWSAPELVSPVKELVGGVGRVAAGEKSPASYITWPSAMAQKVPGNQVSFHSSGW